MNENAEEAEAIDQLDIEAFAKEHPDDFKPEARVYVIRIDRERRDVRQSSLTGREILALVGKTPETHKLFQKLRDGSTPEIPPDKSVSFKEPGVERFMTMPRDTTEGARTHG